MTDKILMRNEDCITGMTAIPDNAVDMILTDPPYGIQGDKLHRHYARKESFVVDGYVEVPLEDYENFTNDWIKECVRILRPGGSFYIVTGHTNLRHILNALASHKNMIEVNHLVWKYNFGVYTSKKYVTSHYHILYYVKKPISKKTFNEYCRFTEMTDSYHDREDVIILNREYKPGQVKNKNQLPEALVEKFILYSSKRGDIVFDPFQGGFTTARVALKYGRKAWGFELNKNSFDEFYSELLTIEGIDEPKPQEPDEKALQKRLKMRENRQKRRNLEKRSIEEVTEQLT